MTVKPPPDDEDIRLVLEARLGQQAQLNLFDPTPGSPIAVVLEMGERVMQTQFLTYWAKGGPPRIFGLDGFSRPVAVFSERVVEIWADFRAVFYCDSLGPDLKMKKIEQIILRTMAEIALTITDEPSLPAQLAIAAEERCPGGLLFGRNEIATLEGESRGLGYMNYWFFAFAHELGHFQPMGLTETWRDDAQSQLIASIDTRHAVPKSYRDEIIARIREGRTGPLLDIGQIVTEALADAFAMIILFESALPVMKEAGQFEQFSMEAFYYEAIFSLNIVATFAQIEQVIHHRRHGVADRETSLEQVFYKDVIGARGDVAFALFRMYLQSKYPGAEVFSWDRQMEILAETARHLQQDIDAWDRGVSAAMRTLFGLQLPCDMGLFLNRLNALQSDLLVEWAYLTYFAEAMGSPLGTSAHWNARWPTHGRRSTSGT